MKLPTELITELFLELPMELVIELPIKSEIELPLELVIKLLFKFIRYTIHYIALSVCILRSSSPEVKLRFCYENVAGSVKLLYSLLDISIIMLLFCLFIEFQIKLIMVLSSELLI